MRWWRTFDAGIYIGLATFMLVAAVLAYGVLSNAEQNRQLGDLTRLQLEQTHQQSVTNGQNIIALARLVCERSLPPEQRTKGRIDACVEGAKIPTPTPVAPNYNRSRVVYIDPATGSPATDPPTTRRPTPRATRRPTPRPSPTNGNLICLAGTDTCVKDDTP